MANILIADDEKEIIKLLKIYLETEDFTIYEAGDGIQALKILKTEHIDIALIDIMMPKMNGYELIKEIRKNSKKYMPIIVLSAKIGLSDRILGIDIGADDYITKPFEPLEVVAKVKGQLRRLNADVHTDAYKDNISVGEITLKVSECVVVVKNVEVILTKAEFKVLQLMMSQPKRVFTKDQIYQSAWMEYEAVDDNVIRVIISRLRDKVGSEHIKTIRGLGYRFEE